MEARAAPPDVAVAGTTARDGRPAWQSRLLEIVSHRTTLRLWYAFVVGFFMVLVLLPTLFVLGYVVSGWQVIQDVVLTDPTLLDPIGPALFLSFGVAITVAAIDLVAGLPLAWLLVRYEFRGKDWLNTLIDSPLAVTTAGLGFSVVLFWGIPFDSIAKPPGALGITANPFLILMFLHLTTTFPYMVRSLAAILEEIEIEYENAARAAGASRLTAARTITLPMFRAGMATGLILVIAKALSDTGGAFLALTLINDPSRPVWNGTALINDWKNQVSTAPALAHLNQALALVSALMIVLSLVLLVVLKYLTLKVHMPLKRVWPSWERRLSGGKPPVLKNVAAFIFLGLMILVPSFFFLLYVFVGTPTAAIDWGRFGSAVAVSFLVGGIATAIDLAVGVPMALFITRGRLRRVGQALDALVNVPYIVPSAALGISLALFWGAQRWIIPSDLALVTLAHVAFTFPFVVRNVVGALEQLDPALEETARTLGAKPVQAFRRVTFASVRPAILAGSIMAFTRSVGETGATLSVVGNRIETVPVLIVNLIRDQKDYYSAAIVQIALLVISFAVILGLRIAVQRRRSRG